jgi:hypothetical protein
MARFQCKCGEFLWNGLAPNDVELRVYTDKEWDRIMEKDVYNSWDIPEPKHGVWRCSKCERVYIFENNNLVKTYVLEKE